MIPAYTASVVAVTYLILVRNIHSLTSSSPVRFAQQQPASDLLCTSACAASGRACGYQQHTAENLF